MRRVIWSTPARDDLRAIDDWLAREADPFYAARTLSAIRYRANWLINFPHGGRPHKDATRVLRVYDTPYLVRYVIRAEQVEVLRVHHERENWHVEP